jgi:hypothetical protein
MVKCACHSSYVEGICRKIAAQVIPDKKCECLPGKLLKEKWAGDMAQEVQHLSGEHEAPSSNPHTVINVRIV